MGEASSNHRILAELGALFCRVRWSIWPVAVEPVGLTKRNYDVIGLKSSPRAIVAMEVKVSRSDFLAGIRKGHFDKDSHITELWLIYPGGFNIGELPHHVGIIKPRPKPICEYHEQLRQLCDERCKKKKNIFLQIIREAQDYGDKDYVRRSFSEFAPKWLWKIAVSNSTKTVRMIESNVVMDWGDEEPEEVTAQ